MTDDTAAMPTSTEPNASSMCVFPDTNIFLHFPPIREIDWPTITKAKRVELIICLTVVHELDSKKSDARLGSRAQRAIKDIREAQNAGAIRDGVTLKIFNVEAKAGEFPADLSWDSADDRIVHAARLYKQQHASGPVAIATSDYGMELRASAGGVEVLPFDNTMRLPNPQDEQTKKYQQAISELNALKNRQPKLSLNLSRPDAAMALPHDITFKLEAAPPPIDVEAELNRVMLQFPKQHSINAVETEEPAAVDPRLSALLGSISKISWDAYNNEIEAFYESYRTHLEFLLDLNRAKSRSFMFDLWLDNTGHSPASDIDVYVRFPEVVAFVAVKGSKEADMLDTPPPAPEPPKMCFSRSLEASRSWDTNIRDITAIDFSHLGDSGAPVVTVNRDDSCANEIHAVVGKLKHGHNACLGTFVAVLKLACKPGSLTATYEISAANLTEKQSGAFPFIVEQ